MNAPIFISYSSKDQEIAETICRALEVRGYNCWIACRDVRGGENFQEAIVKALRSAQVMLLVFTSNANNSDEIKKELVLAGRHRVTVVPVRVEDVAPNDAFTYEFATRQWIDLFKDWEREIELLATQIGQVLQTAKPQNGGAEAPAPTLPPRRVVRRSSSQSLVLGSALVAALSLVGGVFLYMRPLARTSPVVSPSPVVPPTEEVWSVRETPPWAGSWYLTKRSAGSYGGTGQLRLGSTSSTVTYSLEVVEVNGFVSASRTNSFDGNDCNFTGTRNGRQITGQYFCKNGGPYPWSAETQNIPAHIPSPVVPPSRESPTEEVWSVRETPPWAGSWYLTKRSAGSYGGTGQLRLGSTSSTVTYSLEVVEVNGFVSASRTNSSDGNDCNFTGTRNDRQITGRYFCKNGGPYPWSAETQNIPAHIP